MSGLTWVVDFLCVVVGSSSVMVVYLTVLNQKASLFVYESTIYATSVSSMLRVVIHRTSVLFKISSSRQQEMALLRAVIGTTFASLTFNLKHVNYNIFRTMGRVFCYNRRESFFWVTWLYKSQSFKTPLTRPSTLLLVLSFSESNYVNLHV